MGSFKLAVVNYEQYLTFVQNLNDKVLEFLVFRNFGLLYKFMGNYIKVFGYFEQYLQLVRVNKMEEFEYKVISFVVLCYRDLYQFYYF